MYVHSTNAELSAPSVCNCRTCAYSKAASSCHDPQATPPRYRTGPAVFLQSQMAVSTPQTLGTRRAKMITVPWGKHASALVGSNKPNEPSKKNNPIGGGFFNEWG